MIPAKYACPQAVLYVCVFKFIHKNSLNDNVCAKIPLSP